MNSNTLRVYIMSPKHFNFSIEFIATLFHNKMHQYIFI